MSAVPLTDPNTLALICDGCGRSLTGVSAAAGSWDALWELAAGQGWAGENSADGPHRCPGCSTSSPRAVTTRTRLWSHLHATGDAIVVRLAGDLEVRAADELRTLLRTVATSHRHIVLDLRMVHLMDSVGLSILLRAHQDRKRAGGVLCLAAPSRLVRAVLLTMHRLNPVVPVFDDSDAALTWLAAGAAMQHQDADPGRGPGAPST